jgi:uncharacterized membrane protein
MAETPKAQGQDNDKVLAAVATIPLVGLVIYFAMKDATPFVRHYAKQSIGLTVIWAIGIVLTILFVIPVLGWILSCLGFVAFVVGGVLWLVLLINALQGNTFSLPVLSDLVNSVIKD